MENNVNSTPIQNMDMNTNSTPPQSNVMLKVGIFILFIAILGLTTLVFMQVQSSRETAVVPEQTATQVPQMVVSPSGEVPQTQSGSMKLVTDTPAQKVGDTVSIGLQASSAQKDIVGFDALIEYDPDALELINVTTPNLNFQVSSFKKSGFISITGTKTPASNTAQILDNTLLLKVNARVKKLGRITVDLLQSKGNEKTKMIDVNSNMMIPQVESLTISQ